MDTKEKYQFCILRVVVREVAQMDVEPNEAKRIVAWKLRAMSQQLRQAKCYTQAMWTSLLAGEVGCAESVNVVWAHLREVGQSQPPTSNRGVNSGAPIVKSL